MTPGYKTKTIFSNEQLSIISNMYYDGHPMTYIAKNLGMTRWTVREAFKLLNFATNHRRKHIENKICKNCKQNKSINCFNNKERTYKTDTIGIEYGRICKDCIIKIRKEKEIIKFNEKIEIKQIVANLYIQGYGKRAIVKLTNLSRSTIKSYLIELGLNDPNRQNQKTPIPENKICPICPENGMQNISNFTPHKTKQGRGVSFNYCKKCEKIFAKNRYEKQKDTPFYKIRSSISSIIWFALSKNNSSKNGESCIKYLFFTTNQIIYHIEAQFEYWMTWKNKGSLNLLTWNNNNPSTWTWQLDHIIPQSRLQYKSMSDLNFKITWHLFNLRPLCSYKNITEGARPINYDLLRKILEDIKINQDNSINIEEEIERIKDNNA